MENFDDRTKGVKEAADDPIFRAPTEAISPAAIFPRLVCVRGERPGQEILITQAEMTIGRDVNADIKIRDTAVSKQHAVLMFDDREVFIKDLGSANGTLVNGRRALARQATPLKIGDLIDIGKNQYRLDSVTPGEPDFEIKTEVLPGQIVGRLRVIRGDIPFSDFEVRNGSVVGRGERSGIRIPEGFISEEHAKFSFSDGRAFLTDLDSSNGTSVNDHRLKPGEDWEISPHDRIRMGEIEFQFEYLDRGTAFDVGTLYDSRRTYGQLRLEGAPEETPAYDVRPGLSIGRGRSNDIVVPSRLASDKHARVEIIKGRPYLVDLDSVNGTSVNGTSIKRKRLYGRDRIEIGDAVYEFAGPRSPWKTTVPIVAGAIALVAAIAAGYLWYTSSTRQKTATTQLAIGSMLLSEKRLDEAEVAFRKVLALRPADPEAVRLLEEVAKRRRVASLLAKANELYAQGAYEDARKHCDDLLYGLDPENADAWQLKQKILLAEGQKMEAEGLIRDVEKNFAEQKYAEAIMLADYMIGREIEPAFKERAAAIRVKAVQNLEAQKKEARRQTQERISVLENALRAKYEAGFFVLAHADIKQLLEIDPNNKIALQYYAMINRGEGAGNAASPDALEEANALMREARKIEAAHLASGESIAPAVQIWERIKVLVGDRTNRLYMDADAAIRKYTDKK